MNDSNRDDPRSDLQQIVEARADAVKRGEGGNGHSPLADAGASDGVGGTAGDVKNQDADAQ
ncbi:MULTISPECIES: hypothetical protein [unclassified Sphingomonas]|uniref:hypothetical protein n=1 Tax=unclassified Sphingomonas TaxID=196159 RepID=UPI0022B4EA2D|nr:hypothetical protein [Sphingomonas sp. NIBR02145]WHU03259.1 hypothetical protein O3305_01190 [Sphingomonas sp. NIBR02145]